MSHQRQLRNKVAQLDVSQIRVVAHQVRDLLALTRFSSRKLDIAGVLDHLRDSGQIEFVIVEDHELASEYAISLPKDNLIICQESVYDRACLGTPRDCFTLAHELGHLLLHRNTTPIFAQAKAPSYHHFTEDSEWQANTFASELLVDSRQLGGIKTPRDIELNFGVSFEAAGYIHQRFSSEGLI